MILYFMTKETINERKMQKIARLEGIDLTAVDELMEMILSH